MKNLVYLLAGLLFMAANPAFSQTKYWIYFTDKNTVTTDEIAKTSPSMENWRDLPIDQNYTQSLTKIGIDPICKSKWFNAVTAVLTEEELKEVKHLPFVEKIQAVDGRIKLQPLAADFFREIQYGTALEQMDASAFEQHNLNGEGVTIGIIDAGFWQAPENDYLIDIFEEGRVLGYKDWVDDADPDAFFNDKMTSSDGHGTTVMRMIAGKKQGKMRYGLADKAKFFLARTDHGDKEFRGEEDYWIEALEWMDSLGVRLVNTSLGYALGFDDPNENYKPKQMDGKTTMITQAADIAAKEKGMLIVVSAGNEGNDPRWEVLSAPADAQHVLSVGATNEMGLKAGYSSTGPSFLPYIKPNVSCFSLFGTSFSAPVITGFAACLMQYKPEADAAEIFRVIEESSQLYPYGNNYVGYGVPQASRALSLLDGEEANNHNEIKVSKGSESVTIQTGNMEDVSAVLFHKKSSSNVFRQETLRTHDGKMKVNKPRKAQRTTVYIAGKVTEIIWN
ncbi:S8 family serine peptidase [Limibacter armeniacum]|uniref:S8 family serine peptidase n=1 Tax=Limibacter armeniacum TaxID=466084 RepID=UPI002FE594D5